MAKETYNVVLEGKIKDLLIKRKTVFHVAGAKAYIVRPRRRHYSKIDTYKPMFPYSLIGYLGNIVLHYQCGSYHHAKQKLDSLLKIEQIGRLQSEGLGRIDWQYASIFEGKYLSPLQKKSPTVKIRKGLPLNMPKQIQEVVKFALLHDFYNTAIHPSKIYYEPLLNDTRLVELLRLSHDKINNPLVKLNNFYDRWSSSMTRVIRSPRPNRFNWKSARDYKKVDWKELANKIKEIVDNKHVNELYKYVYNSKELGYLNEGFEFGHTSLRYHLLLMANMVVQGWLNKAQIINDYLRSESSNRTLSIAS